MGDFQPHSLTMLFCIVIAGGLTLMMGQQARSESLFYYFRLDDQIPENPLRLADKHIDIGFVRERLGSGANSEPGSDRVVAGANCEWS